jgi:thioesterase domain-containing protein/acyl carrier protein
MVPDRIVALDELPVTPNGKVDRRALPTASRDRGPVRADRPRWEWTDLETMQDIWCRVLDLGAVDPDAEFFDIGGHSLRALSLLAAVEDAFGVELRLADLVAAPTPRQLTELTTARDRVRHHGGLIELAPGVEGGPTLHLVPTGGALRYVSDYRALVRHLPDSARVVTYEAPGYVTGTVPRHTMSSLARWYVDRMSRAQPTGPLVVCGHSFGGLIALEAARRLRGGGRDVERVVLLDARLRQPQLTPRRRARLRVTSSARWVRSEVRARRGVVAADHGERDVAMATQAAYGLHRPVPYDGRVTLLVTPPQGETADREVAEEWRAYLRDVEVVEVEGGHSGAGSLLDDPHVARTATVVAAALGM